MIILIFSKLKIVYTMNDHTSITEIDSLNQPEDIYIDFNDFDNDYFNDYFNDYLDDYFNTWFAANNV